MPMQRRIQIIRLVDTPGAIAAYRRAHDEIWPEIKEGIRQVGITAMDLHLHGNTAVMVLEAPDNIDLDAALACLATLPRQAEWEAHVAQWQQCDPGATSAAKWTPMPRIFTL